MISMSIKSYFLMISIDLVCRLKEKEIEAKEVYCSQGTLMQGNHNSLPT